MKYTFSIVDPDKSMCRFTCHTCSFSCFSLCSTAADLLSLSVLYFSQMEYGEGLSCSI